MLQKVFKDNPFWMKKRIWIPAGITLVFFLVLSVWIGALLSSQKLYRGIFVENLNVSGLTTQQAAVMVENHLKSLYGNGIITVRYADNTWSIPMDDISVEFSTASAIKKAYTLGRSGNIFQRVYSIIDLGIREANISLEPVYDQEKLRAILESIKTKVDKKAQDAGVLYKSGKVSINKEDMGQFMDVDRCMQVIENEMAMKNFNNIVLVVESIRPTVVYDDIKDVDSVLSSTVTNFNQQDVNRTANIKLACERINGLVLRPGEIFSMNKALGPRTIENGYKDAKVIFKNEFIEGPGGGVCQVSTTLYVSVLKAKAQIVERMHHSLPLGYVEPGQDATIAEDYIDFKFKNSYDYPVVISAEVVNSNLYIRILGRKGADDYTVRLKSTVVEEFVPEEEEVVIDNTIPDYEKRVTREAKKGMRVLVYRETYNKSGQLLDKEKISEDVYKPVKPLVKVNQNYYNTYYQNIR